MSGFSGRTDQIRDGSQPVPIHEPAPSRATVVAAQELVAQAERLLGPAEAAILRLVYLHGLSQRNVALILGVSQPTVHYRLRRATLRLRALLRLSPPSPLEAEGALRALRLPRRTITLVCTMLARRSLTGTAQQLRLSRSAARRRLDAALPLVPLDIREALEAYRDPLYRPGTAELGVVRHGAGVSTVTHPSPLSISEAGTEGSTLPTNALPGAPREES